MKRPILFCFYGPESTGKTTMAKQMAERYHTECVLEASRDMITSNEFTVEDIVRIGRTQTARVLEKMQTANRILFCDTDLITTAIYSDTYLHVIPEELAKLEKQVRYDQYFLFDIDVPWVADGLRDLGGKRPAMYDRFKKELEQRGITYIPVSGSFEEREAKIVKAVDHWLRKAWTMR